MKMRVRMLQQWEHSPGRRYLWYTVGVLLFVVVMWILEMRGLPRTTLGYVFLMTTVLVYAAIGILSRTSSLNEYFLAGQRVSGPFNGMATAADWMSTASFIGLAGALYLQGYAALAYIIGWTGGFVLMAVLIAPYLRRLGRFTVPDFLGGRYGGHIPRLVAAVLAIICSFTYVVAQIYGVGLITARLTHVPFGIGVWLGLGGILVCSFLGGMKAVTWTQVAQFIILVIAYLSPVIWLAHQQTGHLIPQVAALEALVSIEATDQRLRDDPRETEVRNQLLLQAAAAQVALADPAAAYTRGREQVQQQLASALIYGDDGIVAQAEAQVLQYPAGVGEAIEHWQGELRRAQRLLPLRSHVEPFAGATDAERDESRTRILALALCLMLGTASLPHVLIRSCTTRTVREARTSVAWALLFMLMLYLTAPALAILVKGVVYDQVVGQPFDQLPSWVSTWQKVAPSLLNVRDLNGDGLVQRAEVELGPDLIVLALPEIAGLPYVFSALVAAGALAAALSTADGLLLTITHALSHDSYHRLLKPDAPASRRVLVSKFLLIVVAALAALMASRQPANILFLVTASFSLAAGSFFPALALGIFWSRATGLGAVCAMVGGFAVTMLYIVVNAPLLQPWITVGSGVVEAPSRYLIWDIPPEAAGLLGVMVGTVLLVVVSFLTPAPGAATQARLRQIRGLA